MKELAPGPANGLRILALVNGTAVLSLSLAVLGIGWGLGVTALRDPFTGLPTMKPNTALGLAGLGASVLLGQLKVKERWTPVRWAAVLAATMAAAIGAGTLAEYEFDWDSHLDQLLFHDPATAAAAFPGRPAPVTAVCLLLLGLSLASAESGGWREWFSTACALAALLLAWLVLNGYLFGAATPAALIRFGSVAPHTATSVFLIAGAVLAGHSNRWPARTVFANGVGGVVCRWLLPPAVILPPALGWLLSTPIAEGQHHTTLNWALYSVFSSAGSVGLILILARRIELLDAERSAAAALSRHDALTGLVNRRAFDEFLAESVSRAQRYSRALSLLSIDVDDFKRYNDSYGHPAGDEVLKVIARTFAAAAREADLVARIGGEEFAIVLPETDAAGARALGERIRAEVASLRQFRRPVTVSIGVATASRRTPTASVLVKQGDAALYAAKTSGRNCVAGAGHAPLPTPR